MKGILLELAVYHSWANQTLLSAIVNLPDEVQKKDVVSSFSSLYTTVVHMWNAEYIWWQRLKLQERIIGPAETFSGSLKEAQYNILNQNKKWEEWLQAAQDYQLQHVFQYKNSKGEQFKQPVYQMMMHVFNHATYHRGQLVTILRQLDIKKIPATDFIVWSRKK